VKRLAFSLFFSSLLGGSVLAQSEFFSPCLWEALILADTASDPIIQSRWILEDGSMLIVEKSREITRYRHHEINIRWHPASSEAENEW
jgi:hypothetical protein